ncbi:ATP-dependent helicase HrpB [Aurantiacibacter gangjinensis]|uniref:ATP-dependent helicase n=1 Tax=Aurantiacibacter gangjinensis TaxID=502682 RepID=A0A0G9MV45_9SPHN|nr:ATP-dependent helicase HrpB [Aurantiacibacter gangjinensis]APE29051.1 ATP-dependent helicase HrpB [Aurantiacibacter gangjinensis]KLE33143.1 ATP-dependent helicase [Aurantiacibacter gangjinensis]
MSADLPIHAVLPHLLAALRDGSSAVLVAPPGAGKTTAVAPALLGEEWCSGQIIITSPRRVAAGAAAERMAQMLGEKVGERVGYLTRLDSRKGSRINVVTEAILVNRLLEDQELAGVSAILFDEAHERHLDSDLGLALALETQSVLREDLRICVMSATIDGARFADVMGAQVPVIESEGKAWPLRLEWLGASPEKRIENAMTSAILTAWREEEGDILAFLPGVGEIERTRERLQERLPQTPVLPLHGQVQPADQRAAIRRDAEGRRRIVLATSIAETSLTLEGVSVVVDSGLARRAEFDRAAGTTHLVTQRASQAASAQRAGRAARQGPGVAYRLWEEGGHAGRPAYDAPEMLTADLAPLVLSLAKWGLTDPASLRWLDTPPEASVAAARHSLRSMGALDESGAVTPWGEAIAQLPMDPASAATVLFGALAGDGLSSARLVALMQERGLGGRGEDLMARLQKWASDRSPRARAAERLSEGWAKKAQSIVSDWPAPKGQSLAHAASPAVCLALARPDFIARRRDPSGESWQSAGGRGLQLDPASSLARAEWLVIADAQGQAKGARITAAAELSREEVEQYLHDQIEERTIARWNNAENRVEARRERRLGAITLASGPAPDPDPQAFVDILVEKAVDRLGTLLPDGLLARARFVGIEALSQEALAARAEEWLAPLLNGRRNLDIAPDRFADAALGLLDWEERQRLDTSAPRNFTSPAGTTHSIDYTGDDAPSVEVRVQALFGLERHPMIGSTPLLLKLTSPAGRPIQATRDLPGFWRGSWADVRKDMKGRYPKHRWPEEPWAEKPSLKTKNAFSKGGG